MSSDHPPRRIAPIPRLSRPATRAIVLEDIARAFLQGADHDPQAAATFAEIGAALIPLIDQSSAVALARLLAGRRDVPEPVLAALAARGLKPKGAAAAPVAASEEAPESAEISPPESIAPAPDLLAADATTRRRLIAEASQYALLDSGPELRRRLDSVASLALARASERRDRDDVVAILGRVLDLPAATLAPLFDEASGELAAIACRAAGLSEDDAIRVFVGVGPAGVRSGPRLQEAMTGFRALERPAAMRLLATITGREWAARGARQPAPHGETRRRAAVDATFSPSSTSLSPSPDFAGETPASSSRAPSRGRG